jgi:hypothetical protein
MRASGAINNTDGSYVARCCKRSKMRRLHPCLVDRALQLLTVAISIALAFA